MKIKTIVALSAVTFAAAVNALSAQSLSDALVSAYYNSPELKSARATLRSVDEGVAQAVAGKRPTIAATATTSATQSTLPSTTRSASLALSLSLTLWDGGDTDLAIDVARLNVDVSRQALIDKEQSVLLAAITAFMNMRRDSQFLQLAENNRSVLARQVQASHDRYEVGEIRRTDVSLSEARLAGALGSVALRQGTLEIARESYFVATGTYPGSLQSPPVLPSIPSSVAAAKSIALRTHPSILQAKQLAKIADLNIYRAEAAMKPKLTVSGAASLNSSATTGDTLTVTLGATQPIYSGGALTSAHRQAFALKEKALSDIQLTGLLVSQKVTLHWAEMQIARASITARQKEVRASRVALRGITEEADLGARTTLDVLDAESDLVEAETNLVAARRDEHVAVYSLLSAMGLLTVRHLQLGVKTYDVTTNAKKVETAPGPSDRSKLLNKILTRAGKK